MADEKRGVWPFSGSARRRGSRERVEPGLSGQEHSVDDAAAADQRTEDSMNAENNSPPDDHQMSGEPAPAAEAPEPLDAERVEAETGDEYLDDEDPRDGQIRELEDKLLRAQAEMQNIQRRSRDEVQKARRYGSENIARELLDVHDNLERAVAAGDGASGDAAAVVEGVELTLKQLDAVFEKHHIAAVSSEIGEKLDPSLHSAMSTQPTNEIPPNHIAAVIQKGYQLHDRLLRPAMVVVAAELPAGGDEATGDAEGPGGEA